METSALIREEQLKRQSNEQEMPFRVIDGTKEKEPGDLIVRKSVGYRALKRTMDIVCSTAALIILLPVFLITAIAVWLEDRGPVFYVQERISKKEKVFNIYKFRSMRIDAEQIHEDLKNRCESEEVSFKLKEDPRVTKVGNFIRKINIDELPQLINILKGDMSIVGPRPLPVYEYEEERKRYGLMYRERYSVPQGLTCSWQISGRADISFEKRMQMDVDYAVECSLFKDIKLIIQTIWKTVLGRAGY